MKQMWFEVRQFSPSRYTALRDWRCSLSQPLYIGARSALWPASVSFPSHLASLSSQYRGGPAAHTGTALVGMWTVEGP